MLSVQNNSIQTKGTFRVKTYNLVFDHLKAHSAIKKIKEFSKHHSLKGITLKQLINEGRKY